MIQKILEWSKERSPWEQDAIRRIWINRTLNATDEEELLSLLLNEHNCLEGDCMTLGEPISDAHVSDVSDSANDRVVLHAITQLEDVNAMSSEETLQFAPVGVTLIYGTNASGKSGYARVLKSACRARGDQAPILPDVYDSSSLGNTPRGQFLLSKGVEDPQTHLWEDQKTSPNELSRLAVFDSQVARIHVDKENIIYLPYGADVFAKHATLMNSLKTRVEKLVITDPKGFLPYNLLRKSSDGDSVGIFTQLLTSLLIDSNKDKRDLLLTAFDTLKLGALDLQTLKELEVALAQDPKKEMDRFVRLKKLCETFCTLMVDLEAHLKTDLLKERTDLFQEALHTKEAARLASESTFKDDPLPNIGGEVWKKMYEAVKDYALEVYPSSEFPNESGKCVFCQQELDEAAKQRFSRFREFVKHDLSEKARLTAEKYRKLQDEIAAISSIIDNLTAKNFGELKDFSPWLFKCLSEYIQQIGVVKTSLKECFNKGAWTELSPLVPAPLFASLEELKGFFLDKELFYSQLAHSSHRSIQERKVERLRIRQLLNQSENEIKKIFDQAAKNELLMTCVKSLNPRSVTNKSKEVFSEAIDEPLKKAFVAELEELQANGVRIGYEGRPTLGSMLHKLKIDSTAYSEGVSDILSEGEQRIVAIAAFLAEISLVSDTCGLIFDDPVSSLDHKWREIVAKRLVREGMTRQVIIFTHDIVFFDAVRRAADDLARENSLKGIEAPIYLQETIIEKRDRSGCIIDGNHPWEIQSAQKMTSTLRNCQQNIAAYYRKSGTDETYLKDVRNFYEDLRQAWERAVELDLFNGVVRRFSLEVQTLRLQEVRLEDNDYILIESGMDECSKFVHNAPAPADVKTVTPEKLLTDLGSLETFLKTLSDRKKATKAERKGLTTAKKPELMDLSKFMKREQHQLSGKPLQVEQPIESL